MVGSTACIAPYLPNCTREAVFSLMPTSTILFTALESSLDVVLLEKLMAFQLLKDNITGQYIQLKKGL